MFEHGISNRWLKRARFAIWALFGTAAAAGLGCMSSALALGDLSYTLIGVGLATGCVGLGVSLHCITHLAAVIDANTLAMSDLRRRADAMEALVEQIGPSFDLGRLGHSAETLVAASSKTDLFPRLVSDNSGDVGVPPQPDTARNQSQESASTSSAGIDDLRAAFRDAVYSSDFDGALSVGRRIAMHYPGTPPAAQFEELRQALEQGAANAV